MTTAGSPHALTQAALSILVDDLEGHGNVLSDMHRAALCELLDTFTGYCAGTLQGRVAFPLPTGMGKTSAVVAFLAALHRLGYMVPVSVAASKVEALCTLKRDLLAHGIPEDLIGLKHAVVGASEPSTGDASRLFQLVTHARVRLVDGRDFQLFGTHEGRPRPLCIYDETLMRADSFAFAELDMRKALACMRLETERTASPLVAELLAYLGECEGRIGNALAALRSSGDPNSNGVPVSLPPLEPGQLADYLREVGQLRGRLNGYATSLETLLSVSQEDLQVLTAEQGGGAVAVREAVPAALRNVVVLDASTPVRELARLDPTIRPIESFAIEELKSYEAVEVHQLLVPGGRGAIEGSFAKVGAEAGAAAREVIDIVKDNPQARAFLIFSFLPRRGQVDVLEELKAKMRGARLDLSATTSEGRPRFEFLTWGNQEGLNGYEHCDVVIMAGVLHRSHLDMAAAVRAQTRNLREPTPSTLLRAVIESEVAHVVLQGASRGSCRRITNGKAWPMKLYLVHKNAGLKAILDRVMPGAAWHYPQPRHLKKAAEESRAAQLRGELLAYLRTLPETVAKVSSRELKKALGLSTDDATRGAFVRARDLLDPDTDRWVPEGRSLVRVTARYGFSCQDS